MEYITPQDGRHYIVSSQPINHSSKRVYRNGNYLFHHEAMRLTHIERWESCYFNIKGKRTAISGQLIPTYKGGGFKPSETDDTYFDNLATVLVYQRTCKQETGFHDKTHGIHQLLVKDYD